MKDWLVRLDGATDAVSVPTPQRVLEGLRDGDWEPTDAVRGPGDRDWLAIEDHPVFAEAVAEMGPPPPEKPDETRLDMNPLIDVALVLLIFFILTTSYASLRRAIELPPSPSDEEEPRHRFSNRKISRTGRSRSSSGWPATNRSCGWRGSRSPSTIWKTRLPST